MQPIISPVSIYLVDVLSKLSILSVFVFILSTLIIISSISAIEDVPNRSQEFSKMKKFIKKIVIIDFIALLGILFIPSKEDLMLMLVFSQITPDNLQLVNGDVTTFVNNIIHTVKNNF